jgi:hypothetical protein
MRPVRRIAPLVAALTALAAGCGGDGESGEQTRLDRALAEMASVVSPPTVAYGWVDLHRLPAGTSLHEKAELADSLTPGGNEPFTRSPRFRRIGLAAEAATAAYGTGASYAFGVRLDGVDGGRLAALLRRGGAAERAEAGWALLDLGPEGVVPDPLLGRGLTTFGARVAVRESPPAVVLAANDDSRAGLIGSGEPLIEDPGFAFASSCLGEVAAAEIMPGNAAATFQVRTRLIAIGARPAAGGWAEVLCAIEESEAAAERNAAALRAALAPQARDPVSDEPMGTLVRAPRVSVVSENGMHAARAALIPTARSAPGFLFGALARGSLLAYLGYRAE